MTYRCHIPVSCFFDRLFLHSSEGNIHIISDRLSGSDWLPLSKTAIQVCNKETVRSARYKELVCCGRCHSDLLLADLTDLDRLGKSRGPRESLHWSKITLFYHAVTRTRAVQARGGKSPWPCPVPVSFKESGRCRTGSGTAAGSPITISGTQSRPVPVL